MLDPDTLSQLEALEMMHRPLLVCDVDEVILHLVAPFEQLLDEQGYELRKKTIQLNGNIFSKEDGTEAELPLVWNVLTQLFEEQSSRQDMVEGAALVLQELNRDIDILLLTNLPHKFGDTRRDYLAKIDIPYPLVTNSGAKGPVLKWLEGRNKVNTAFVDDTPHHLESVHKSTPDAHLVHFMANNEFRDMIGKPPSVILSTGNWSEAGIALESALTGRNNE